MKPGANSANVLATAIVSIPLGTLAVALRLYTRKYLLKQVWIDDYLAIASWVSVYSAHLDLYKPTEDLL